MALRFRACISLAMLVFFLFPPQSQASRSSIEEGYLLIPRIDFDDFGALELRFRIAFDTEYLLVLEETVEALLSTSNSGVFDPEQLTLDIDEVELENGDVYAMKLGFVSQQEQIIFNIIEAIHLNPAQESTNSSSSLEIAPEAESMFMQQCSSCHATDGSGTGAGPSLLACANCGSNLILRDYITNTMPLGQSSSCDASCASVLANYIIAGLNGSSQAVATQTVGFIRVLDDSSTLRKAAQQLLSRLPTLQEQQLVSAAGDAGLKQAIDGMMEEEAFYVRLTEIFNDYLLTDKYHSRNGSEAALRLLSSDDYPNRRWFDPEGQERAENYSQLRRDSNDGVAREPLALINHVVRNNRPFTEILTAPYMMVNPYSAKSFGATNVAFTDPNNAEEYRPMVLQGMPHAGILTSPMFLNRYPTTSSNRNRGRARVVYDLFLDTDILAIEGVRPGNAVDITTPVPTINNVECSKCHSVLDPVASVFQNWNHKGQYRPARLSKYGWYTDMESRGFNGVAMPLAGNIDSSVQWLAQQIAADPRFPKAVTRMLVNGITGKEPLKAPLASDTSAVATNAYIAERTLLNDIQNKFVADNYNLKTLLREIILSPYWRADGLVAGADSAEHAATGSNYLLTPEQLDRKIESLLGFDWRRSLDYYYKDRDNYRESKLNRTYHQIYGGIDSDNTTSRLRTPNGLMGAMQLRMANELACYAVPYDFWLPSEQRRLFLFVEHSMTPYNDTGAIDSGIMSRIRNNLQYLHKYFLDEELPLTSSELKITEDLFMNSLNRGRELMLANAGEWQITRLPGDCDRTRDLSGEELPKGEKGEYVQGQRLVEDRQFVIRSWMAVVAYLLSDYKFLYN